MSRYRTLIESNWHVESMIRIARCALSTSHNNRNRFKCNALVAMLWPILVRLPITKETFSLANNMVHSFEHVLTNKQWDWSTIISSIIKKTEQKRIIKGQARSVNRRANVPTLQSLNGLCFVLIISPPPVEVWWLASAHFARTANTWKLRGSGTLVLWSRKYGLWSALRKSAYSGRSTTRYSSCIAINILCTSRDGQEKGPRGRPKQTT